MPSPDDVKPLDYYIELKEKEGAKAYIEWINDYLGVQLTKPQREIIHAIHENQKTLIVAGNGFGKTYALACFSLAFLFVNYPASVLATSGTYSKLRRTYCRPVESLHSKAGGLPGKYLRSNPPRIRIEGEPEVFWEAASPGDSGELEGVHNEYTLGVVEEADKDRVTEDTFDSMESMLTDANDKLVAVANPPKDEINVVYDLMDDPSWTLKQYSSFESHNVSVELDHPDPYQRESDGTVKTTDQGLPILKDEVERMMVPELVRLNQIKKDWMSWNVESWPGVQKAMRSHEREDLDIRWYRRRMGVIAPASSSAIRPFTVENVEDAYNRAEAAERTVTPTGLGWDVVRGGGTSGDYNAMAGLFGRDITIFDWWRGKDHLDNYETIRGHLHDSWTSPFAIDSVGVGSEAPDRVGQFYPNVVRFNAGSNAADSSKYTDRWTEGLCLLGEILRDGGRIQSERLREELLVAARVVELEEKYSNQHNSTRYWATRKKKIKQRLGRSPDLLDAALMAVCVAETGGSGRRTISSSF